MITAPSVIIDAYLPNFKKLINNVEADYNKLEYIIDLLNETGENKNFKTRDINYLLLISSINIWFTLPGLAVPLVSFITWPTKKPIILVLPDL